MFAMVQCPFLEGLKKERRRMPREGARRQKVRAEVCMNSSDDVLYEVMKHMDVKSLATSACVSRKWKKVAEDETLWENVCIQRWPSQAGRPSQLRAVVLALGGFRRLYVQCLRPLMENGRRLQQHLPSPVSGEESVEREWSRDEVNLSLSLFSIDCYERLGRRHMNSKSLKLLCKPSANLTLGAHRILAFPKPEANVR